MAVLKRDDACRSLNDPGWSSACRTRALGFTQLQQLVLYLVELGLDEQLQSLWIELVQELDHRVLDHSEPPSRPRMLFLLLRGYLTQRRPMKRDVSAEVADWDRLDARCGPLWPSFSEKFEKTSRWIGEWPSFWLVAPAVLVLAFGAGIFQGCTSLPPPPGSHVTQ